MWPSLFPIGSRLNSWLLFFHSSSSNKFFKIAKRKLDGRGDLVKFVHDHRICFVVYRNLLVCSWGQFKMWFWRNLESSKTNKGSYLDLEVSIFCQNSLILSRDPVPLIKWIPFLKRLWWTGLAVTEANKQFFIMYSYVNWLEAKRNSNK